MDLKLLIKRVKETPLFTAEERKYWLSKLEVMKDEDLEELNSILEYADSIDWDKALDEYETAVTNAEQACDKAEKEMAALSS